MILMNLIKILLQKCLRLIIEDTKHEANTRYETSILEDNTLCANITASAALTESWHISVAKCPEASKKFSLYLLINLNKPNIVIFLNFFMLILSQFNNVNLIKIYE